MSAWRIEKVADEGSSSPYYARLWAGIPELRDAVLNARVDSRQLEAARYQFDEQYEPVLRSLDSARKTTRNVRDILKGHRQKLEDGGIVRFQRNAFEISESISDLLRDHFAQFLNNVVRALKGSQEVVKYFGVEIGCLFTKDQNFVQGIAQLKQNGQSRLADFLSETRSRWSANLIQRRHDLEHKGWTLPNTDYRVTSDGKVEMHEPQVDGQVVSAYTHEMFNRVTSFG